MVPGQIRGKQQNSCRVPSLLLRLFLLQYYIYFHQTNLIFGLLSKQSIFENYTHTSVCPLRDHSLLLKKQAAEAMVGMFSQGLLLCRCSAEWTKKGLRQLKQGPPPRCDAIRCSFSASTQVKLKKETFSKTTERINQLFLLQLLL